MVLPIFCSRRTTEKIPLRNKSPDSQICTWTYIHLLFYQESKYHQTSSTSSRGLWMSFSSNSFPFSLMASCFWKFQIHLNHIAYGLRSWLNQTSAENHGKWTHSCCASEIMYTRIMHMHALCDMVCMQSHRFYMQATACCNNCCNNCTCTVIVTRKWFI